MKTAASMNRNRLLLKKLVQSSLVSREFSTMTVASAGAKRSLASARPLRVEEVEEERWSPTATQRGQESSPTKSVTSPKKAMKVFQATPLASPSVVVEEALVERNHSYEPSKEAEESSASSPRTLTYTEGATMPITTRLHIVTPEEDTPRGVWPVFRLMDENGTFQHQNAEEEESSEFRPSLSLAGLSEMPSTRDLDALRSYLSQAYPHQSEEFERSGLLRPAKFEYADVQSTNTLYRAYRQMIRLSQMDHILLNAQRQGRISFYMTCRGEEAIHMGAASALELQDPILAQYREQGLLMWRGFSLDQFTNQCFSNAADLGKGRQMPVHYGSRALNYHTVSSPLGTQLPQAVGVAYRLKLAGRPNVAACFFGDGCASTIDFHSALNFAATLKAPVLFFCRNNGYAISTPTSDQYQGDGIISRAPGYGMAAIRVDGNDIFAVHAAVREARRYALEHSAPVLIEAMTYRQGHHSTSDDSTRYRSAAGVDEIAQRFDPITRLGKFLQQHHWLSLSDETAIRDQEKIAVLKAMEQAERRPPPPLESLFEDVYHEMPPHLREQESQLREHVAKFPKRYNLQRKH